MALHDQLQNDRMELLKWVSERNMHVPLSDLAFMLDLSNDCHPPGVDDAETGLYDCAAD